MDPDGKWTSTRATLLAAAGQNRWPPAGNYMAATGQDLMAADRRGLSPRNPPGVGNNAQRGLAALNEGGGFHPRNPVPTFGKMNLAAHNAQ